MRQRRIFPSQIKAHSHARLHGKWAAIGLSATLLGLGLGPMVMAASDFTPVALTGSGTTSSPYMIDSPGQLIYFDQNVSTLGDSAVYELGANINMSGYTEWTPITGFTGTFDGESYTISNLAITSTASGSYGSETFADAGLFGDVEGATIENVTLDGVTVSVPSASDPINLGLLVGLAQDSTTITNVSVTNAEITFNGTEDTNEGGVVGYLLDSTLTDTTVAGTVGSTSQDVGSSSEIDAGGLVGESYYGTYSNDTNTASVSAGDSEYPYAGGLIGYGEDDTLQGVSASGAVTGTTTSEAFLGGLEGYAYGETFTDASASGSVSVGGTDFYGYVGGLIGDSDESTYQTVSASGSVSGGSSDEGYDGGLIGYGEEDTITQAVSSGSVSGGGSDTSDNGGLIGWTEEETLTDVSSSGTVSTGGEDAYGGGLIGYGEDDKSINGAQATGSVSGSGTYYNVLGGLIGDAEDESAISNTLATGAVQGTAAEYNYLGGSIGYGYYSSISDSYSTGAVGSGAYVGGFTGQGYSDTYTSDYWDTTTSGLATDGSGSNATGETSDQLMEAATFSGWNFSTVWQIDAGVSFPTLIALPQITGISNPNAVAGEAYSATLITSSALPQGVTLGATSTNLPSGLSLAVSNGVVTLSGTPTTPGTDSIPVSVYEVEDGAPITVASGTVALTVNVAPVTGLAVVSNSLSTTGWTETWSAIPGASAYVVDLNGTQVAQVNNSTTFTFNNETPGTAYQVTVAAIVGGQQGAFSAPDTVSTPAVTLMAPLVLQHSQVSDSGWLESWSAVYGATGYEVALNGTPLVETSANVLSYAFGGEHAATSYSVTVASVYNGAVGPFSTQDIVTTNAPPTDLLPAPTGLSHSQVTSTGWQETWNAVYGATGYQLELNGQPIAADPLSSPSATITTATPGTTYEVTVAAVYDGVVGNYSSEDTVTTTGPAQQLERVLTPGWNTLSIPYALSSSSLASVTAILNQANVVYAYSAGNWEQVTTSNVSQVLSTPMVGLYIDWPTSAGSTTVTLTPTSTVNPPPTYSLTTGWNLVGPSSISPSETDTAFLAGLPADVIAEIVDPNGNPEAASNPLASGSTSIPVSDGFAYWVYSENSSGTLTGQIPTGSVN